MPRPVPLTLLLAWLLTLSAHAHDDGPWQMITKAGLVGSNIIACPRGTVGRVLRWNAGYGGRRAPGASSDRRVCVALKGRISGDNK